MGLSLMGPWAETISEQSLSGWQDSSEVVKFTINVWTEVRSDLLHTIRRRCNRRKDHRLSVPALPTTTAYQVFPS
ncbi:hypothetical protein H9L39_02979 [Fusarium oxysporum f. sp. albedinis]|nr:hypothetical protein H9L39_02979 [Fusarium oxysporum f. sp. albedinis]